MKGKISIHNSHNFKINLNQNQFCLAHPNLHLMNVLLVCSYWQGYYICYCCYNPNLHSSIRYTYENNIVMDSSLNCIFCCHKRSYWTGAVSLFTESSCSTIFGYWRCTKQGCISKGYVCKTYETFAWRHWCFITLTWYWK